MCGNGRQIKRANSSACQSIRDSTWLMASLSCPDVGDSPNQPRNISFPKVSFGKAKPTYRSFNVGWFDKWSWLHWDVATERAYCHTCVLAYKQNKLRSLCADPAFISRGYQNWKDATAAFRTHETSACHKESVQKIITLPATTRNVIDVLSSAAAEERKCNQACFLRILSSLQFLARQGLALRGDGKQEVNGNFSQLLALLSRDDQQLSAWLKKKTDKYTGHDMQNEILQIMALRILRELAANIQSTKFTIMVDKTTDISTTEQVVIVLHWVVKA